jgi:hypothetical protein
MASPKLLDLRTAIQDALEDDSPETVLKALSLAALKLRDAASRVVGHPVSGMVMSGSHVRWLLEGCDCEEEGSPKFSQKN